MKIIQDQWQSCYPSQWKGLIVPEATKHPAKFSSKLIRHIYDHMTREGWLQSGDIVLDPFGGVALGALDAMLKGIRWVGVELEPKFADIGQQNIRLWNKRFCLMPHWNSDSRLLNGDSRMLLQVLQQHGISVEASTAVSSPPYADSMERKGGFDPEKSKHAYGPNSQMANSNTGYSDVAGSISSPPYAETPVVSFESADQSKEFQRQLQENGYIEFQGKRYTENEWRAMNHGRIDGRTTRGLKKGATGYSVAGAVSSPPYAVDALGHAGKPNEIDKEKKLHSRIGGATYSGAAGMISSPPYSEARIGQESGQEQCGRGDQYGATDGQLGSMKADGFNDVISSPPFGDMVLHDGGVVQQQGGELHSDYGQSEGQLGSMKADGFDDVISSPPFIQQQQGGGIASALQGKGDYEWSGGDVTSGRKNQGYQEQGQTEGQLGAMKDGNFDGAVTSPPYEATSLAGGGGIANEMRDVYREGKNYGDEDNQVGSMTGDSFWFAARQIVHQTYLALRPGGHAVWVVKAFVKDKAIVDFPNQWRLLCESVGFVTLHEHHAMLTNHKGTSHTLEGGEVHHKTEAKSFFRRNGENKARAEAWWNACDLTRDQKAEYLRCAHEGKWLQWHTDVEKYHDRPIKPPKAFIIRGKAQMMAWEDAGSPDVEIATSIDYETVFCMVKPVEA